MCSATSEYQQNEMPEDDDQEILKEDAMYFGTNDYDYESSKLLGNYEPDQIVEEEEEEEEDAENFPGEIVQIHYGDGHLLSLNQVLPHKQLVKHSLALDDVKDFVRLVRGKHQLLGSLKKCGYEFSPSLLLWWAIENRAVGCARALIAGRTNLHLDINSPLLNVNTADGKYYKGLPPLFIAAEQFLSNFVHWFFTAGARADLCCNQSDSPYHMMLPIHVVLQKIRKYIYWTPAQPVHYLMLEMSRKEMTQPLRTIGQLMAYSPLEMTHDVIYQYAKEGKIIEFAVLLFVGGIYAINKFNPYGFDYYRVLRLLAAEEYMIVVEEEQRLLAAEQSMMLGEEKKTGTEVGLQNLTPCMIKKQKMTSMLELLEIFHRTNFPDFDDGVTAEQIARKLLDVGFDLDGDFPYILKAMPDHVKQQERDLHSSLRFQAQEPLNHLPKFMQSKGLYNTMPIVRMLDNERRSGFARALSGKRGCSSVVQMLNTSERLKSTFAFMPGTSSRAPIVMPCNKRGLHVTSISFIIEKWAVISSYIKKGVKYV